jgi:GNAT superfamily N-acetyltransferase
MKLEIRRGRPSDLELVQQLNHLLFKFEHDHHFYPDDSFNLNWPYEAAGTNYFTDLLSASAGSIVLISQLSHQPVGYLAASVSNKSFRRPRTVAELENMFVIDQYRRTGAGRALMTAFKDWASSMRAGHLRVAAFAGNDNALKFYRACGFLDQEVVLEQPGT